jgi:hypothetical protein
MKVSSLLDPKMVPERDVRKVIKDLVNQFEDGSIYFRASFKRLDIVEIP